MLIKLIISVMELKELRPWRPANRGEESNPGPRRKEGQIEIQGIRSLADCKENERIRGNWRQPMKKPHTFI